MKKLFLYALIFFSFNSLHTSQHSDEEYNADQSELSDNGATSSESEPSWNENGTLIFSSDSEDDDDDIIFERDEEPKSPMQQPPSEDFSSLSQESASPNSRRKSIIDTNVCRWYIEHISGKFWPIASIKALIIFIQNFDNDESESERAKTDDDTIPIELRESVLDLLHQNGQHIRTARFCLQQAITTLEMYIKQQEAR